MGIILKFATVGLLSFALLFNIISVATPGWLYFPPEAAPVEFPEGFALGLFDGIYGDTSTTISRGTAERTAFAFDVLAEFTLMFALAFYIMTRTGKSRYTGMLEMGKVFLPFIAALFIMIGMSVYTALQSHGKEQYDGSWGYSYLFGWMSFCLSLIGGAVAAYTHIELLVSGHEN